MKQRIALVFAMFVTACMGSFNIEPGRNISSSPTPTAFVAGNQAPGTSAQASATPQTAMSAGPSVAPSTAKTAEPLKSPTPQPTPTIAPTPTSPPKTLWTQVVPGVEVMDESVLEFSDSNGNLIKPRKASGVAAHIGGPGTPEEGIKELWIQFNDVGGVPSFVAYDVAAATWSVRVSSSKLKCLGSTTQCHPDDYPLLVNQYSDDEWISTKIPPTPIVTAQSSRSFTVELQSMQRWYGVSYTRIIDKSGVVTVPITEDFARVLLVSGYYDDYKDRRGVSVSGHSAWYNDRLYYTTQYSGSTALVYSSEWSNLPRVVAWWSKSDNSWRVTELPFAKNAEVREGRGILHSEQPLYTAIDPASGIFFFVVPEQPTGNSYGRSNATPLNPLRMWGTLYKVSADYIHENGVLVSVK